MSIQPLHKMAKDKIQANMKFMLKNFAQVVTSSKVMMTSPFSDLRI